MWNTWYWKALNLVTGVLLVGLLAVLLADCGGSTPAPATAVSMESQPPPQELLLGVFFSKELRAADFWIAFNNEGVMSGEVRDALYTGDPLETLEYTLSSLQEANNKWKSELASGTFRDVYTVEQVQLIDDATRRMAEAGKALWDSYANSSWSGTVLQNAIANLRWSRLQLEMIDLASESRSLSGQMKMYRLPPMLDLQTRGKEEARRTEFQNIAAAVTALMVENKLANIPNPYAVGDAPCTKGTKSMYRFPDNTSNATNGGKLKDPNGIAYNYAGTPPDKNGYLLFSHDIKGSGAGNDDGVRVNYVSFDTATYCYKVDADGTVHQYTDAGVEQTQ